MGAMALAATGALAATRNCVELMVPVTAYANNTNYEAIQITSNPEAAAFTVSYEYVTRDLSGKSLTLTNVPAGGTLIMLPGPRAPLQLVVTTLSALSCVFRQEVPSMRTSC